MLIRGKEYAFDAFDTEMLSKYNKVVKEIGKLEEKTFGAKASKMGFDGMIEYCEKFPELTKKAITILWGEEACKELTDDIKDAREYLELFDDINSGIVLQYREFSKKRTQKYAVDIRDK